MRVTEMEPSPKAKEVNETATTCSFVTRVCACNK